MVFSCYYLQCLNFVSKVRAIRKFWIIQRNFVKGHLKQLPIKIGDRLPEILVYENTPDNAINIAELFQGKRGLLFAVPGAFTPGCSKAHIPDYLKLHDTFKKKGIDLVACISVNDPFVMAAWAKNIKAEGKIRMLADPCCEFTKAMDMELPATSILGTVRSKRYSLLIEDSIIKQISTEPDDSGLACLLCLKTMRS